MGDDPRQIRQAIYLGTLDANEEIQSLRTQLAERDAEIAAKESQLEIAAEVTRTDVAKCEAENEKLRQWQRKAIHIMFNAMPHYKLPSDMQPEWMQQKVELLSEVEGDD